MSVCTRRRRGLPGAGRAKTIITASLAVAAVAALAVAAAACGSSTSQNAATQPGQNGQAVPTAMQVLTKVELGDLTQSVAAPVKVKSLGAKTTVVATVPAENAAAVAKGQPASVVLFNGSQGGFPQAGQSGMPVPDGSSMPQPQGSGMPQPGQSGMPQPGQSGMPQPGQSGMPGGGQGGLSGGDFSDRGTAGAVTAVVTNADGTATATIRLDEAPADATAESSGFASIQTKVLASDVIVIPTAAIKGSGSSATVEVMVSGKTETRTVQVGQQSGSQSEIVSGLTEGENIVWYRSFPGLSNGQGQGSAQQGQGESTQGGTQ
jgi:membrane fusion protein, macrolide-specific efflux system